MLSLTSILDIFFPPSCASCHKKGSWWCADCRSKIEALQSDPCKRCLGDHRKKNSAVCTGTFPFSGVVVTGYYHAPELRKFITSLKYQGVTAGAKDLEEYLCDWKMRRTDDLPWNEEKEIALIPMPLASARERERGFNQSEWIAERMKNSVLPNAVIVHAIERISSSTPQATIDDHELRRANVRGGFVSVSAVPDAVILVDDVMTTGATCREASRVLMEAGAKRVYVFTLALGK